MDVFRRLLISLVVLGVMAVPPPAYAMKDRTVVLRAAGSGTLLGIGAGLITYPLSKSTSSILFGAIAGALVGTVYGFYLVDQRDRAYSTAGAPVSMGEVPLGEGAREISTASLAWAKSGKAHPSFEVGVPLAVLSFNLK